MGAALRAHNHGVRLGDILTAQQLELVSMGEVAQIIFSRRSVGSKQAKGDAWWASSQLRQRHVPGCRGRPL